MKYLYKITFLLMAVLSSASLFAQDIQFSYVATPNGDNTTTVVFSATNTGAGVENLATFTINFYYDDNETTVSTVDFTDVSTGLGWGTANETIVNHQPVNNPSVPITHTGYFVYQNIDNNFTGIDLNPGQVIQLGTVVYDNSDNKQNDGGAVFIATINEQPGLEYSGNDFMGHPVLASGTQQQILPIVIRSFTATKEDKNVNLEWTTESEVNGSHFEIERSQDLDSWTKLGVVEAVGESSTLQDYSFLDDKLPLNARTNHKTFYYRLNMVDNDGYAEYSEIRTVRFDLDGEGDFIVYPNPSIDEVYVNLSSINATSGNADLLIIDMNGKLVKKVALTSNDDINVDVSLLNAGAYYFIAKHGTKTYSQKVIKVD